MILKVGDLVTNMAIFVTEHDLFGQEKNETVNKISDNY